MLWSQEGRPKHSCRGTSRGTDDAGGAGWCSCRQKLVQGSNGSGHNISSIKKLKIYRSTRTMALSKGEGRFIKDDIPGDYDSFGGEVKADVSFVVSGIA